MSTAAETKSFILLDGYQFIAGGNRWTVEFDYDYSISNSMRPPLDPQAHGEQYEQNASEVEAEIQSEAVENTLEKDDQGNSSPQSSSLNEDEATESDQPLPAQVSVKQRIQLSQLDNMIGSPEETPTQPLPRVQNLVDLKDRKINSF